MTKKKHLAWPPELTATETGLALEGVDLDALAADRGTPLWVTSHEAIRRNFEGFSSAFKARHENTEVAYSIKANNNMAVIRLLYGMGAKIDASAEYEYQLALLCGVDAADIILNGNGKSDAALRSAAQIGVRQINIDSMDEVQRVQKLAAEAGTRVNCVVRIQLTYRELLGNDPSFESTLRIGEGKFGSNIQSGEAMRVVEAIVAAPNLDFVGLHHHVAFAGYMADFSADREVQHHRDATKEVCEFAETIRKQLGVPVDRLNLGGGFRCGGEVVLSTPGAAADLDHYDLPAASDYADAVISTVEATLSQDDIPVLQFETGGQQIANAVHLLARVSEVKNVEAVENVAKRRFVTVDAGSTMFMSKITMRVGYPIVVVSDPDGEPDEDWPVELVGQSCVYDSIAEDIHLPSVKAGDLVAVLNQGAYCEAQSTQFNGIPRPEVVLVDGDRYEVIKRREVLGDIYMRDSIPERLWKKGIS